MKVTLEPQWILEGVPLDDRVLPLLHAIERSGSLAQARDSVQLSYRHAWTIVGDLGRRLGAPLVQLQRGRGATLTEFGNALLAADRQARRSLASAHRRLAGNLEQSLSALTGAHGSGLLRARASHDLALAVLEEHARKAGIELDLHFQGSLDALDALRAGRCDIAGFHIPVGPLAKPLRPVFATRLFGGSIAVHGFATRTQGLIVRHGNPKKIRRLADLVRPGLRFINRQPGSGTRLLFDALLAQAGIEYTRIAGYGTEEFTHAAIAAAVASGMADAGFGIEAAAARAHLAFIPFARERYFLAFSKEALANPAAGKLLAVLRSAAWRKLVNAYAGYDAKGSGRTVAVEALLGAK
jgi:molybdate transport repressor ModE-like protein